MAKDLPPSCENAHEDAETFESLLCVLEVSDSASRRTSFGIAWLVLHLVKKAKARVHLEAFSIPEIEEGVSHSKIFLLLESLPASVEDFTLGAHAVSGPALPRLCRFLTRSSSEGTQGGERNFDCPRLKALTFSAGSLHTKEACAVFPILSQSLETLNLKGNKLGTEAVSALAEAVRTGRLSGLRTLSLEETALGRDGMKVLCASFRDRAAKPLRIETLCLSHNRLWDSGFSALCLALRDGAFPFLRALRVDSCEVKQMGVIMLSELLSDGHLHSLETLDLQNNDVGTNGGVALGGSLLASSVPQLRCLSLRGSAVSGKGVDVLVDALKSGNRPPLESVDLSLQDVGENAARSLGEGGIAFLRTLSVELCGSAAVVFLNAVSNSEVPPAWEALELCLVGEGVESDSKALRAFASALRVGRLGGLSGVSLNDFDKASLGSGTGEALSEAFSCPCVCLPLLSSFSVQGGDILEGGNGAFVADAVGCRTFEALEALVLIETGLGGEGMKGIFQNVLERGVKLPRLETLRVSHSPNAGQGVGVLAAAIAAGGLPRLKELDLSSCGLDNDGLCA
uniref:Uncharacterized protein n=1 Tax=Chromera velia CCMP2878 TaxID=1169474 RepID=A0A0G4HLR4_9ALVE|eukprot:Cvel_7378.t1-p1 / transcript=Cvel_7378.t1 / gene=Cvel_7378 / organism=Chromera_velia_CCMP2878 / gene_product=Protein NLRC3, putative / transcript_product=Protein NLRC3, putative / location=Cvel_scaffold384:34564-39883(-) / protein_length=568 / sequence_SO=supercontig / SO=protein_coding / is_pseudo=false